MSDVLLRHARPADAGRIADVHRLSRADYYGEQPDLNDDRQAMWLHLLSRRDRMTYVAEAPGAVIGFMSAHRAPDVAQFELVALYVLPQHYGHGIGSRLHDAFLQEREDDETAVLEVWAGNGRAIEFYRHRGWTPTSTTRSGPHDVEFVTYQLRATPTGT